MTKAPSTIDLSALPAPAFRLALFYSAGIWIGAQSSLPACALVSCATALWALTFAAIRLLPRFGFHLTVSAGLLVLSCGAVKFALDTPESPRLPDPPFAAPVLVTGTLSTPAEETGGVISCTLVSDSCYTSSGGFPLRIRISVTVRSGKTGRIPPPFLYGMNVLLKGAISAPPAEHNPGGFSLRRYDENLGIAAVLLVEGAAGITIRDSCGGSWFYRECVYPARGWILRRVGELLPGNEGEFLKDLLLGERSGISPETREAFIDAGVAHVLTVSGYRIFVVVAILKGALGLLRIPGRMRPFIAAPAVLFYMALAGGHPPVVRGTVMSLVFMVGEALGRRTNSRNALGVAALLVLGENSHQLFDAGFQLSFGAVMAILFFMPSSGDRNLRRRGNVSRIAGRVLRPVLLSVVVSLGTLPLAAACFGRVSLIGVLTNIAVVPATGVGMILGFLSLAFAPFGRSLGAAYAALDGLLLQWITRLSLGAASLPFASVEAGDPGIPEACALYSLLALMTRWKDRRGAARCLVILLLSLNAAMFRSPGRMHGPAAGGLRLSMIDVGQGDAILVEFPGGENLLVDAGPVSGTGDAGRRIIVPFLKARGIRSLDVLLITHPDADHCGGAASIMRSVSVGRVIESSAAGETALSDAYHAEATRRGSPLSPTWRGASVPVAKCARLYVLSPPRGRPVSGRSGSNNASVVFKLVYGDVSFLFTGDAEGDSEKEMIRSFGSFLRSTVLKVAHHGSDSGTSQEFLGAVRPSLALISVGLRNRFHHPSSALLWRLSAGGARVLRTDREGAILLDSDGKSVREISWR